MLLTLGSPSKYEHNRSKLKKPINTLKQGGVGKGKEENKAKGPRVPSILIAVRTGWATPDSPEVDLGTAGGRQQAPE